MPALACDGARQAKAQPREAEPPPPGITGAHVLNETADFIASVLYARKEQVDAYTLLLAVTHTLGSFNTVPLGLFTAQDPEAGKSTGLHLGLMLAYNAWKTKATPYAVRAKFNEPIPPTLIFDEISKVFGESGLRGHSHPLYEILTECYESTATISLAVDRAAEDRPAFCVAILAGLKNAVPRDIRSRCIEFRMRPIPPNVPELRDALDLDTRTLSGEYRLGLHQWVRANADSIRHAYRNMRQPHPKFRSRRRQLWGPLYAVALAAGEDWPERCMAAFKAIALDASDLPQPSPPQMILRDVAACFTVAGAEKMFAADIASRLRDMAEVDLYQKLTDRGLAQLMTQALGPTTAMTIGAQRARGFYAGPVLTEWEKLRPQLCPDVDDEAEADELDTMFDVEDIPDGAGPEDTEVTQPAGVSAGSTHVTEVTHNGGNGNGWV